MFKPRDIFKIGRCSKIQKGGKNMRKKESYGLTVGGIIFTALCVNVFDFIGVGQKLKIVLSIFSFFYYIYLYTTATKKGGIDNALLQIGKHVSFLFILVLYTLFIARIVSWTNLEGITAALVGLFLYAAIATTISFIIIINFSKKKQKNNETKNDSQS